MKSAITLARCSSTPSAEIFVKADSCFFYPKRASTVCSSKGQTLQLTSVLDFLSIQAYRLWMEHPSGGKVNSRVLRPDDQSRQMRDAQIRMARQRANGESVQAAPATRDGTDLEAITSIATISNR